MSKTFLFLVVVIAALAVGSIWFFTGSSNSSDQTSSAPSLEIKTTDNTNGVSTASQEVVQPSTSTATTTNSTNTMNDKYTTATLHTTKGDITIEFSPKDTPNTVANFVKLAGSGFYDGVKFHRVIKDFMIQSGDPLTKDDSQMDLWGTGGPGYSFADELTPSNKNDIGTISMANSGPNTNGSQFFINVANNNFLDTKHVVFGKVTAGMDVVMDISKTKTGPSDRPITPIVIESITLK